MTSSIVYGPVPSRRLGRSLGINNVPPKAAGGTGRASHRANHQYGIPGLRRKAEWSGIFNWIRRKCLYLHGQRSRGPLKYNVSAPDEGRGRGRVLGKCWHRLGDSPTPDREARPRRTGISEKEILHAQAAHAQCSSFLTSSLRDMGVRIANGGITFTP